MATKFEIHKLFQPETEDESESPLSEKSDHITQEYKQFDQANWALSRIYERGNTFLRQFDISENGDVRPLQVVVVTNMLEDLLIGGVWRKVSKIPPGPPLEKEGTGATQKEASWDFLFRASQRRAAEERRQEEERKAREKERFERWKLQRKQAGGTG